MNVSESEIPPSTAVRARPLAGISLAALGGLMLALQARVNGQLGAHLHDGVAAAAISFGSGVVLLAVGVPAFPAGRRALARFRAALREHRLRWWQCIGGLSGAFLVSMQGFVVATIGVAVFTVAVVAGQVLSSLAVDRAGIGPAGPQPLTVPRLVGAALAVLAVLVSVSGQFGDTSALLLAVLPAVAGVALAWQAAINGLVQRASGSSFVATLVNFAVGTAALLVVLGVLTVVRGLPGTLPGQWYLYLGGPMGIVVIASAAIAVRLVGVLLFGLASVSGQLIGALLVDLLLPAADHPLQLDAVLGTALTLVAVAVAALRRPRER